MYEIPRSLKRKKHHRKMMKLIKHINQNIINDELWQGRFIIHPIDEQYIIYEDMSGAYLVLHFEIVDKKTGYARLYHVGESAFVDSDIYNNLNKFIVEYCKVWEKENPYEEAKDYSNIKVKPWSFKQWRELPFPYWDGAYREVGDD